MPLSQIPTYNLKAVLKETGIAADTLRAWERRYGIPMPERTPGGHRLYSQRDIHVIKWLMARQAEGMIISRAANQWNELAAQGLDPLAETQPGVWQGLPAATASLDALREDWLAACLNFNESSAEQILNQAFALYSLETVVSDLLRRGLHEIGEMWQRGQASVQQEHFISALAMRRFDSLINAAPSPIQAGTIVLACPPAELHTLPLLYLNLMLRRRSRNVIFLGADVPTGHLEETIRAVHADLVVMCAQRLTTAASLKDTADLLAKKRIPVGYGGRIFNQLPALCDRIAGEYLGKELEAVPDRIEQLLARPVAIRQPGTPGDDAKARAYRDARSQIESIVQQHFAGNILLTPDLAQANGYFGSTLAAALDLGDVAYLEADMPWIKVLLARYRVPSEGLHDYLVGYAAAMREAMGATADEPADWLERYASEI